MAVSPETFFRRVRVIPSATAGTIDIPPINGGNWIVTPDEAGVKLRLPDATTLPLRAGGPVFFVMNRGIYPLTIVDQDDAPVWVVASGRAQTIVLSDHSTPAGKWHPDLNCPGTPCYYPVYPCVCEDNCCWENLFSEGDEITLVVNVSSENPLETASCTRTFEGVPCDSHTINETWEVDTGGYSVQYAYSAADGYFIRVGAHSEAPLHLQYVCASNKWQYRMTDPGTFADLDAFITDVGIDRFSYTLESEYEPDGCENDDPVPGSVPACTDLESACSGGGCPDAEIDSGQTYTPFSADVFAERQWCAATWENNDCTGACEFLGCVDSYAEAQIITPGRVISCAIVDAYLATPGACDGVVGDPVIAFRDPDGCWVYIVPADGSIDDPGDATILADMVEPNCAATIEAACDDCPAET